MGSTKLTSTRQYLVWSAEEEEALRQGVRKHGLGAWEIIRKDPEFLVLESRTGVQLKDKWRNLVKFRHISPEESKKLKPKHSGPWSRKYSASGATRERSLTHTPSTSRLSSKSGEHVDDEHVQALLALEATKPVAEETKSTQDTSNKRHSLRASARSKALQDYELGSDVDEKKSDGPRPVSRKKRRRSTEDKRFGIYDQRRYKAGQGPGAQSDGTTTETDDEEQGEEEEHEYVVDCSCGVKHDDGAMMIECESCQTWSHIDCLRNQMAAEPARYTYNLDQYVCSHCQAKRQSNPAQETTSAAPPTRQRQGSNATAGPSGREANNAASTAAPAAGVGGPSDEGDSQVSSRSSKDRTNELSSILLGLANGSRKSSSAPESAPNGTRPALTFEAFPKETRRRRHGRQRRRGVVSWCRPVLQAMYTPDPPELLARAVSEELVDSISQFLTGNKVGAAGVRTSVFAGSSTARGSSSPGRSKLVRTGPGIKSPSPANAATMAAAAAAMRARAEAQRAFGGSSSGQGVLAAPKPRQHPAVQRNVSQQSLNKLLHAANTSATLPIAGSSGKNGLLTAIGPDGRLSPGALSSLNAKRSNHERSGLGAGSSAPITGLPPLSMPHAPTANPSPDVAAEMVAMLCGDNDNDNDNNALSQTLRGFRDDLYNILRAPTPSQMFIDTLLRGTTPDINIAPLLNPVPGLQQQLPPGSQPSASAAMHNGPTHHDPASHLYAPFMQAAMAMNQQLLPGMPGADLASLFSSRPPSVAGTLPSLTGALNAKKSDGQDGAGPSGPAAIKPAASTHYGLPPELAQLAETLLGHDSGRPGTPDPWALLRATTPDTLSGLSGLLPFGHDFAGAPWLLSRTPPPLNVGDLTTVASSLADHVGQLSHHLPPPPPVHTITTSGPQPAPLLNGGTVHPSHGDNTRGVGIGVGGIPGLLPPGSLAMDLGALAALAAAGAGAGDAAASAAAAAAAAAAMAAASAAAGIASTVPGAVGAGQQEQTAQAAAAAVAAATAVDDGQSMEFNIEDMLRSNTPAPR